MRTLVTFVAGCELAQHCLIMRFAMAILALWYNSMFVSVAENTQEACMFGRPSFERTSDVLMAGTTILVWNLFAKRKCQRLMNLVTFYAIGILLCFSMGLVTIQAVRLVTMLVMTERTVDFCMSARHPVYDFNNP